MPPRVPKVKTEESQGSEATWKSRFPVARIKKIMQADEDVGKVAQVVPVIISKAVELFMASMVEEASRHAVETGHKRVVPGHLKMAVKGHSMFDFLEPNVEKIPDVVHIGARPSEEKKVRKSRAKRSMEHIHDEIDVKAADDEDGDADGDNPHKKVKAEHDPIPQPQPQPASRSMSIANMMSPDPA